MRPEQTEPQEQRPGWADRLASGGPAALTVVVAVAVWLTCRDHGAYYISVWAPLAMFLVLALVWLSIIRRAPGKLAALGAAALLLVGAWGVLSISWGGIPNAAWTLVGQMIAAAAALLVASALAVDARSRNAIRDGVLLGLTAHALEILIRLSIDGGPRSWFLDRVMEGPVGYHNAQATMFALGVPVALVTAVFGNAVKRALAGAATSFLLAGLILTQSRGGVLAVVVAIVALLLWARDARLALFMTPVVVTGAGLVLAVRRVDAALVDGTATGHVGDLRRYVVWSVAGAVALAAIAAAGGRSRRGRTTSLAVAGISAVLVLAGAVHARSSISHAVSRVADAVRTNPDREPGGSTRFASLSLNGRREAWSLAWTMTKAHPLAGAGQGRFSRTWGTDRPETATQNYIIQPHSIELEYLAELGIAGFAAFAIFVGIAVFGATRASRPEGAQAVAVLLALGAEASVDWTWSFPAAVVTVMLVVGAALPGVSSGRFVPVGAATVVGGAVAIVALGAPFLSDRQFQRGTKLASTNPDRAWQHALSAQRLNPWDDRVYALEGRLAQASGQPRLAAAKYRRSAALARQPWVAYLQEAGALQIAHDAAGQRAACAAAQAADPLEQLLRQGACDDGQS